MLLVSEGFVGRNVFSQHIHTVQARVLLLLFLCCENVVQSGTSTGCGFLVFPRVKRIGSSKVMWEKVSFAHFSLGSVTPTGGLNE